jgi:hypothetical protein
MQSCGFAIGGEIKIMTDDKIRQKFQFLLGEGLRILSSVGWNGKEYTRDFPSSIEYQRFKAETMNIVKNVCGENSAHYVVLKQLAENKNTAAATEYFVDFYGVLEAARRDFEGGYLFDLEKRITGELFGDFVNLSKAAMKEGHKEVAAVLACAALEDALKRYARGQGLDVDDQVMQSVVNALKSKGLVSGAQKTLLDAMPKVRDFAMHANWDKITPEDVSSVIGFVEQFLVSHF